MNLKLPLELTIAATLDVEYTLDIPADGGSVTDAVFIVRDLCVEDEKRDLLTGTEPMIRYAFEMALGALINNYDVRMRAYSEQLEGADRG